MSEYLAQLQGLLFSEDESNLELALELVKSLEIDAWPLYSDLQKCSEFFSEKFKISPNVKALLRYLHHQKGLLNFSNRQLQHLPSYLSALGELVTGINLSYNQFSQLPDCIAHFSQLTSLNFNDNLVAELPKWLFNLRLMEVLNCRNCLVYEIPDEISQLSQLGLLEISNHPRAMLRLSPKLGEMKKLAVVKFSTVENSKTQDVDIQLFNMPYLRYLLLSAPNLKKFPATTQLTNLGKLCLLQMPIPENLAFTLAQMPQLKTLAISHYQPFSPYILADLPHLSDLLLSRQMIPYAAEIRQLLPNTNIDFGTFY